MEVEGCGWILRHDKLKCFALFDRRHEDKPEEANYPEKQGQNNYQYL